MPTMAAVCKCKPCKYKKPTATCRLLEQAKLSEVPFVPSGSVVADQPTRKVAWDMMNSLRKWIQKVRRNFNLPPKKREKQTL